MSRSSPRPRLGRRIARGLLVLVELAEREAILDAPRLFALDVKDRDALDGARAYARRLATWYAIATLQPRRASKKAAPPPQVPETRVSSFQPIEPRLWEKVQKTDSCWIWTGTKNPKGYGRIVVMGKPRPVHRVAYELVHGTISDSLHLDHLCRRRDCVRPDHLEPVTNHENALRGARARTHCRNGHLRAEQPRWSRAGHQRCETCYQQWHAANRVRSA